MRSALITAVALWTVLATAAAAGAHVGPLGDAGAGVARRLHRAALGKDGGAMRPSHSRPSPGVHQAPKKEEPAAATVTAAATKTHFTQPNEVLRFPNGTVVASTNPDSQAFRTPDNRLKVVDLATGGLLANVSLGNVTSYIYDAFLVAGGDVLVVWQYLYSAGSYQRQVNGFRAASGQPLWQLANSSTIGTHQLDATAVWVSSNIGTVRLLDPHTGAALATQNVGYAYAQGAVCGEYAALSINNRTSVYVNGSQQGYVVTPTQTYNAVPQVLGCNSLFGTFVYAAATESYTITELFGFDANAVYFGSSPAWTFTTASYGYEYEPSTNFVYISDHSAQTELFTIALDASTGIAQWSSSIPCNLAICTGYYPDYASDVVVITGAWSEWQYTNASGRNGTYSYVSKQGFYSYQASTGDLLAQAAYPQVANNSYPYTYEQDGLVVLQTQQNTNLTYYLYSATTGASVANVSQPGGNEQWYNHWYVTDTAFATYTYSSGVLAFYFL